MTRTGLWTCAAVLIVAAAACSISDEDRCAEGRIWNPTYKGCVDPPPPGSAGATGSAGSAGSAGAASAKLGTDCAADGKVCETAKDGATTCVTDVPGMAFCSIAPCDKAKCGDVFQCCTCPNNPPVCLPDDVAPLAKSALGCTCE